MRHNMTTLAESISDAVTKSQVKGYYRVTHGKAHYVPAHTDKRTKKPEMVGSVVPGGFKLQIIDDEVLKYRTVGITGYTPREINEALKRAKLKGGWIKTDWGREWWDRGEHLAKRAEKSLAKSYVKAHTRKVNGKTVRVREYWTKRVPKPQPPPRTLREIAQRTKAEARRRGIKAPTTMLSTEPRPIELTVNTDPRRQWRMQANQAAKDQLLFVGIREAFQNGLDAMYKAMDLGQIKKGEFRVDYNASAGTMTISDNGTGMDWDTCLDKFLSLGSSGKEDETGAIGGFGVAKAYILGMVDASKGGGGKWTIRSDGFEASSDMLGQPPTTGLSPQKGVTLTFEGIERDKFGWALGQQLRALFEYTDTQGQVDVYLNGQKIKAAKVGPDVGYTIESSVDIPDGLAVEAYLPPAGDEHLRITRLVSPKWNYKMVQTVNSTWNVPTHIVVDLTSAIRPGEPGYPFDMARLSLVGPAQRIENGIVESIRQDPHSATIKHEYRTEVFEEAENIVVAQQKAAAATIDADAGLSDALTRASSVVKEMVERVRNEMAAKAEQEPFGMLASAGPIEVEQVGPEAFLATQMEQVTAMPASLHKSPIGKAFVIKIANDYPRANKFKLTPQLMRQLVAWDSILRMITVQLVKTGDFNVGDLAFKPGIVLKEGVIGMNTWETYEPEVAAAVGKNKDRVILFNPDNIKGETPDEKALWLRDLACHEIAHFYASWHDETFTSAVFKVQELMLPIKREIEAIGEALFAGTRRRSPVQFGQPRKQRSVRRPSAATEPTLALSVRHIIEEALR